MKVINKGFLRLVVNMKLKWLRSWLLCVKLRRLCFIVVFFGCGGVEFELGELVIVGFVCMLF